MPETTVRYGERSTLSDERFMIRAVTLDDEGILLGDNAHVLLRDEDTGEEWRLSSDVAKRLAKALTVAAKALA